MAQSGLGRGRARSRQIQKGHLGSNCSQKVSSEGDTSSESSQHLQFNTSYDLSSSSSCQSTPKREPFSANDVQHTPLSESIDNQLSSQFRNRLNLDSENLSTEDQLLQRKKRFEKTQSKPRRSDVLPVFAPDEAIVGTCTDLEKSYFRLNDMPLAEEVRPPAILALSLDHVISLWNFGDKLNYLIVCDQFKSIRQDLVVQQIRSLLTVHVYESHCITALEAGDREEFRQCQFQLTALYREAEISDQLLMTSSGSNCKVERDVKLHRVEEFIMYRILHAIYAEDKAEISQILISLSSSYRCHPYIEFSLNFLQAWLTSNYFRIFHHYREASSNSRLLIAWFLERERLNALQTAIKAFRPKLSVSFLVQYLGFNYFSECFAFLSSVPYLSHLDLTQPETVIDCKDICARQQICSP